MTEPADGHPSSVTTEPDHRLATARAYGPAVGEPPPLADPRRVGSLVGLVGGMVFVGSYSSALGPAVSAAAWLAGLTGVAVALTAHYVRPVSLGPLARLRPYALGVYAACVIGEIAIIAAGSRSLVALDRDELQPALIATVVGLHFIPFAWAFRERMFHLLGGVVAAVGAAGLLVGALGVPHAADVAAVVAGLVMIGIMGLYARGRFAPLPRDRSGSDGVVPSQ